MPGVYACPNPVCPEHISSDERLQEVTSLLAAGFLRYWASRRADGGENCLDVLRTSSDECVKPRSEGESL